MIDHLSMVTAMHFPHARSADDLTCEECQDKACGVCDGMGLRSLDVLDCMKRKVMCGWETL